MAGVRAQQALKLVLRHWFHFRGQAQGSAAFAKAAWSEPKQAVGLYNPPWFSQFSSLAPPSGLGAAPPRSWFPFFWQHVSQQDRVSAALTGLPCMWMREQGYTKRAILKKRLGNVAWIKVGADEECPPGRPNQGSVKRRKHKKRMLQRAEFAKVQAQTSIKCMKLAIARRDSARVKRWKEGAERAKAWAAKQLAVADSPAYART